MSEESTMRAIEIASPGGPDALVLTERVKPTPAASEVLIRVAASGINRPDVLQRMGLYPPPDGASDLPGLEVAGTIEAVGSEVKRWSAGDAVCALLPGGGYAEYAVADAGACLPVPSNLSPEEASSLPETVFTVWANVFEDGDLKPGETLLVHGGTSGIGVAAVGLARAFGCAVVASASSNAKCDAILKRGATSAFRYDEAGWEKKIAEAGGVDVVLDIAGGEFVQRNLEALKPGGRHVSIAFLRGSEASINIMSIMTKRLRLSGSTMKARSTAEKARLANVIESRVWPLIENGAFRPKLDRIFPLANAADAHRRMEAGDHIGKIVLTTG